MFYCVVLVVFTVFLLYHSNAVITECESNTDYKVESSVPDCNCRVGSVDYAINKFISPILSNLTTQAFFRYFKVELGSPCPYWKEDGQCMMEGCSVCTCDENEIPKPWILSTTSNNNYKKNNDFGWITSSASSYGYEGKGHDDSLGRIVASEENNEAESIIKEQERMQYETFKSKETDEILLKFYDYNEILTDQDIDDDDHDDWTILDNFSDPMKNKDSFYEYNDNNLLYSAENNHAASYVNLLNNPERFTGYSGPSASKVWKSIQEENCFGEINDKCLEKRIFHRLMSGLQSSISTHIAKEYLHSDNNWGFNYPLYWSAVGNHPDRLNNMYFAFLFLLRAVVRAADVLLSFPYITGNDLEDLQVRELLSQLLAHHNKNVTTNSNQSSISNHIDETTTTTINTMDVPDIYRITTDPVQECQRGFDESELFQVSDLLKGQLYWSSLEEKQTLKHEFMLKFRNISSIMNCVTCEKCQLWGKLQILGIGTAIKILLTPIHELQTFSEQLNYISDKQQQQQHTTASGSTCGTIDTKVKKILNRQEIIALINTLNQFSNSLLFAAEASNIKYSNKEHLSQSNNTDVSEVNHSNFVINETVQFNITQSINYKSSNTNNTKASSNDDMITSMLNRPEVMFLLLTIWSILMGFLILSFSS